MTSWGIASRSAGCGCGVRQDRGATLGGDGRPGAPPTGRADRPRRHAELLGIILAAAGAFAFVEIRDRNETARTTARFDPPVWAGQNVPGACSGGFYARREDLITIAPVRYPGEAGVAGVIGVFRVGQAPGIARAVTLGAVKSGGMKGDMGAGGSLPRPLLNTARPAATATAGASGPYGPRSPRSCAPQRHSRVVTARASSRARQSIGVHAARGLEWADLAGSM